MDAIKELSIFKKKVDVEIEKYLDQAIEETCKADADMGDALKHVKKIVMAGGKRARPALMYYGYLAVGGKELQKIIKTSVSIELIHLFLLIHDDIIDKDGMRHGVITTHEHYKKIGKTFIKNNDPAHFGISMAIIIGDTVGALGNQIIFNSGFDPKLIIEALFELQGIISMTVIGESEDIHIENRGKATVSEILKMYENKTAKYTFEGPLHLGAILGGANKKILDHLSKYAIPIGIAFQIQDDILGVFGSEEKTGKPTGSDIRQGKYTILVAKAMECGNSKQRKMIKELLGNNKITEIEIEEFRVIIRETGSAEYASKLSKKLVLEGKAALDGIEIKQEAKDFLKGIADYMINREL